MSNPNPEQFARVILLHLAGLRADVAELQIRFLGYAAKHDGIPSEAVQEEWKRRTKELTAKLYSEALTVAGLEELPPSAATDDSRN